MRVCLSRVLVPALTSLFARPRPLRCPRSLLVRRERRQCANPGPNDQQAAESRSDSRAVAAAERDSDRIAHQTPVAVAESSSIGGADGE